MEEQIKELQLEGRKLVYLETGDTTGFPIFFAHGSPGTCLEGHIFSEKAKQYGFRFISVERPGMGHTLAVSKRHMSDAGNDILLLADMLNIDKFGVMGWSGGGAPAIATAYVTPSSRLKFCLVCAGYTNLNFKGAYKLIPPVDRIGYLLANYFPFGLRAMFAMLGFFAVHYPEQYLKSISNSISVKDIKYLGDPKIRKLFLSDQASCFESGAKGVSIDAKLNYLPWDFELSDVMSPVDIFHGTNDHFVPFCFSEQSQHDLSSANLHQLDKEGHLFPFHHQDLLFGVARKRLESSKLE